MSRRGRDFRAYLASSHFAQNWRVFPEFAVCIRGKNFKTLAEFRRWARETFPTFYREQHFFAMGRTGKETIDLMWGDFLQWQAGA